jgi:hypothetical protein
MWVCINSVRVAQAAVSEFDRSEVAVVGGLGSRPLLCLACWIAASFIMIWFNRWLYTHNSFPYPLLLTTLHMLMTSILCLMALFVTQLNKRVDAMEHAYEENPELHDTADEFLLGPDQSNSIRKKSNNEHGRRRRNDALLTVLCGFFYALSLSSGSVAYLYLTVPCMQMMKAALPVFTLLAMFAVGLEPPSWQYFQIVSLISIGVIVYLACLLATAGQREDLRIGITGFVVQATGIFADCMRLTILNLLLGRRAKNGSNRCSAPIRMTSASMPMSSIGSPAHASLLLGLCSLSSAEYRWWQGWCWLGCGGRLSRRSLIGS